VQLRGVPLRLAVLLLALGVGAVPGRSDTPAKPDPAATPREETYVFTFDSKPWTQVIEWFADTTGLAFVGNHKPAGTFTFIPPKVNGALKKYTVAEVIDLLNEALQVNSTTKRYVLVRRSQTFTLIPADDKIPRDMIATVDLADLPRRGRTEIVRVNVALEGGDVEELAPKLKSMMTQLGDAIAIPANNHLVLVDTVGSLMEVLKTIKVIGQGEAANRYVHQCKYIKAREGEHVLRELFGLPPVLPAEANMFLRLQVAQQVREQGGKPNTAAPPKRPLAVASSDDSNVVIVAGPADKVTQAKQTLIDLEDKAKAAGAKEQPIGGSMVKRYPVPGGEAGSLAQLLQEKYRHSSSVRVVNLGPNELMVWAPFADQFDIAGFIGEGVGSPKVKIITLKTIDAYDVEDTLKGIFGDRSKFPRAPYVESRGRSSIIVHGNEDQIAEIEAAIKRLDVATASSSSSSSPLRVISLERGTGTAVAEELQKLLKAMGKDAKIVRPGVPDEPEKPANPEKPAKPTKVDKKVSLDAGDESDPPPPTENKSKKSMLIIPSGGHIAIVSDDPAEQQMAEKLLDLITAKNDNEEFAIIHLKNTKAVDVARLLDEMYNGPRLPQQQQQQQQQLQQQLQQQQQQLAALTQQQAQPQTPTHSGTHSSRYGSTSGSGSSATSHYPKTDRIRVLADENQNAILVKGAPIDVLSIKAFVRDNLDVSNADSKMAMKNHVLPLKWANAHEVEAVLTAIYREHMNVNPLPGRRGGGAALFAQAAGNPNIGRPVDATGNVRPVEMSIDVDERTNALILQCTGLLFEPVKALVEELDLAAKDTKLTVKVRSVRGIDPTLVQRVIDSIQGRRPNVAAPAVPTGMPAGGFGNGGGILGGGVNPGGPGFGGFQIVPAGGGGRPGAPASAPR